MEGGAVRHIFERDPPKDHPCQVWFNSVQGFQRRRFKCESLRRTTVAKWWQKLTWPLARWAKNCFIFIYLVIFESPRFLETVRSQYINKYFTSPQKKSSWTVNCDIMYQSLSNYCNTFITCNSSFVNYFR